MAPATGLSCWSSTLPRSSRPCGLSFLSGAACAATDTTRNNAPAMREAFLIDSLGVMRVFFLFLQLAGQVQTDIDALVPLYVDLDLLRQMQCLSLCSFHALEVGPHHVVGLAGGNALGKLAG